jgi:hypothetical protein
MAAPATKTIKSLDGKWIIVRAFLSPYVIPLISAYSPPTPFESCNESEPIVLTVTRIKPSLLPQSPSSSSKA